MWDQQGKEASEGKKTNTVSQRNTVTAKTVSKDPPSLCMWALGNPCDLE